MSTTTRIDEIAELRRWLRYSQEDLELAGQFAQSSNAPPRHACFYAQQSAEKAIKAIFVFLQVDFPFQDDLELLLAPVPDDWQLKRSRPDLSQLSGWGLGAQYPDTSNEATTEDATLAVQTAQTVFESVTADLRQRGFAFETDNLS
jgi:HEPN domain-containing protein